MYSPLVIVFGVPFIVRKMAGLTGIKKDPNPVDKVGVGISLHKQLFLLLPCQGLI